MPTQRSKYPWGASPRRFTTALLATVRRGGRLCPPKHRVAVSFRASDRCHWRGNPSPFHVNSGQRPPPTFTALRQRRDLIIALSPEGVSKEGGSQPSLFGRFKVRGFLRGEGNRNPSPLKWRSLVTFFRQGKKVTRGRQNTKKTPATSRKNKVNTKKQRRDAPLFFVHCREIIPRPQRRGSAAHGWTERSSASPRRWP